VAVRGERATAGPLGDRSRRCCNFASCRYGRRTRHRRKWVGETGLAPRAAMGPRVAKAKAAARAARAVAVAKAAARAARAVTEAGTVAATGRKEAYSGGAMVATQAVRPARVPQVTATVALAVAVMVGKQAAMAASKVAAAGAPGGPRARAADVRVVVATVALRAAEADASGGPRARAAAVRAAEATASAPLS